VAALGVYPYITASIILQLLIPLVPRLEALQREPGGNEKIQRYTYYLAIPMALFQSYTQIQVFSTSAVQGGSGSPIIPGFGSDVILTLSVLATMTAGTMFAIWLGELITEQGIGNGVSIIIFAGIVAQAPGRLVSLLGTTQWLYNLILFILIVLLSLVAIVYVQEGVRRIPVQYGKRVRGRKQYGGASTYIPMKVNPVGMIPLIFAQSIITLPAIFASFSTRQPGRWATASARLSATGRAGLLGHFLSHGVGFTFFYTEVLVGNPESAENLQRNGGFIPGIRPGKRTQEYIVSVTRRITIVGALFLGTIAVLPGLVDLLNRLIFPLEFTTGPINAAGVMSGSGLIIVVGVVVDTMRQLEAQLVMRNYEGFMR
jgi:preprotein translocase subunit SecY